MITFYRISDGSYKKERFGTKEECFRNFLWTFVPSTEHLNSEIAILADNCSKETINMLYTALDHELGYNRVGITGSLVNHSSHGNGAASWRHTAQWALNRPDDTVVYFLEDDYLHRPGSKEALLDGLQYADYISLYDHNDKYINGDVGGNPFVEYGGEVTRVIRTKTSHWKLTNSTTMTFATTVKTLKDDWDIWDQFTNGTHPNDFSAFLALREKGRSLMTPIPGFSTHCEPKWASPGIDWTDYYEQR